MSRPKSRQYFEALSIRLALIGGFSARDQRAILPYSVNAVAVCFLEKERVRRN